MDNHNFIGHANENMEAEAEARMARANSPENIELEEAVNQINRRRDRLEVA